MVRGGRQAGSSAPPLARVASLGRGPMHPQRRCPRWGGPPREPLRCDDPIAARSWGRQGPSGSEFGLGYGRARNGRWRARQGPACEAGWGRLARTIVATAIVACHRRLPSSPPPSPCILATVNLHAKSCACAHERREAWRQAWLHVWPRYRRQLPGSPEAVVRG